MTAHCLTGFMRPWSQIKVAQRRPDDLIDLE